MKYEIVLMDLDDTIFDFQKGSEESFRKVSKDMGLPCGHDDWVTYRDINQSFWDRYSNGEISTDYLKLARFEKYKEVMGIDFDTIELYGSYEKLLSSSHFLVDGAKELLEDIWKSGIRIYAITNGMLNAQYNRLVVRDILKYFTDLFISEKIGFAKPSKDYCEIVFKSIENFNKDKTIILGDSLLTDIRMGNENSIDTCLFTPKDNLSFETTYRPTYIIHILEDFKKIIGI